MVTETLDVWTLRMGDSMLWNRNQMKCISLQIQEEFPFTVNI